MSLLEEVTHLLGAGKTRLVEHVKMPIGWIGARLILSAARGSSEGRGLDSGLAKLAGGAGCRSKSLDGVAALFRAFTDGLRARSSSRCRPVPASRGSGRRS